MLNVIHILGASGSGTSTLGQALELAYGYKWLDTDNYYWLPTDPPFTRSRPRDERLQMLKEDIAKFRRCVVSGSLGTWGDDLIPQFDLVIWVDTPTELRIERLRKRESERFGDRILEGGDMYADHEEFIAWAKAYEVYQPPERGRILHEEWISKATCPVIRLDGSKPVADLLRELICSDAVRSRDASFQNAEDRI
jgi:adenylate kinase family enzyme